MTDQQPKHDEKGRFMAGGPGGPGRKSRPYEQAILDDFRKEFGNGNRQEFYDAVHRGLKRGDGTIIKMVASYLMGNPPQDIDTNVDGLVKVIVEYVRASGKTP
jgi:hypothetical protein